MSPYQRARIAALGEEARAMLARDALLSERLDIAMMAYEPRATIADTDSEHVRAMTTAGLKLVMELEALGLDFRQRNTAIGLWGDDPALSVIDAARLALGDEAGAEGD